MTDTARAKSGSFDQDHHVREHVMNDSSARKLTGFLLILTPVAFNVFFTWLSMIFEYPDILRKPASEVLRTFDEGGDQLVAVWYAFMLTAVLFIPLAVLVHRVLARPDTPFMAIATAFGITAGIVQFLGLIRWPFLVPYLADTYLDPESSESTRESSVVVFEAFNRYAGVAVGENLGYLFTATWTALAAIAMLGSAVPWRSWLAGLGMIAAAGILIGTLEPAGFDAAGNIVVFGYILWSIWLAVFGVFVLRTRSLGSPTTRTDPASALTSHVDPLAGR